MKTRLKGPKSMKILGKSMKILGKSQVSTSKVRCFCWPKMDITSLLKSKGHDENHSQFPKGVSMSLFIQNVKDGI